MNLTKITMRLETEQGTQDLALTETKTNSDSVQYIFGLKDNGIEASVTAMQLDDLTIFTARVHMDQTPFRENNSLSVQSPITITIWPKEQSLKICAQYQHRDWWSRPAFETCLGSIPARTQSLFLQYPDTYGYFLPMAGDKTKTYVQGDGGSGLEIRLTSYTPGLHQVDEICLLYGESRNFHENINSVWKKALELKKIPGIKDRQYPEMFEYLGWCSWDAFYTDINEDKVRQKVAELKEKQIPVRWLLLDDGWLSVKDQALYSMEPEKDKFPQGFAKLTEDIRRETKIDHIGVWHAFGGYWGGILPGSELAGNCRENLYETKNEKLIPHYDPDKGFGFWRIWYELLKDQGIDFVKVDGQSALKNYYRNNEEIGKVAKGAHKALEAAVYLYMGGNLINCMGMAAENIMNRPVSGLSRNSDDFVPGEEKGFREHMLQNAYNALYHSQVYHCDWDMFWSEHMDAYKHALVRAISGGPVYVSDRIGETNAKVLRPLAYHDGRLLRMDRCALPAMDCVFDSPLEKKNLTLTNTVNGTGAAAVFHLGEKEEAITTQMSAGQILGCRGEEFLVYHHGENRVEFAGADENIEVRLNKDEFKLLLFIPKRKGITPVGLTDKYMSCHSVKEIREQAGRVQVTLLDGGMFAFHGDEPAEAVFVDGLDMTAQVKEENGLSVLDLSKLRGELHLTFVL